MSEQLSASFGVSLTREEIEQIYFTPVIEFPQDERNSAPIYLPRIVIAQDQKLPEELEDQVWAQHDKDDPLSPSNGGDDPLKLGDTIKIDSTIPIKLPNDQGAPTEFKTEELQLARYGIQVMHVYGPATHLACGGFTRDPDTNVQRRWCSNVDIEEKIVVFLPLSQSESGGGDNANPSESDASGDYNSRQSLFADTNEGKGNFSQQKTKEDTANSIAYLLKFNFAGRQWRKTFLVPANRFNANKQINPQGRKQKKLRETLHFSGSETQSIKYPYDNSEVFIVEETNFINEEGSDVSPPKYKGNGKFTSPKPVWGTLIVEYVVSYSEFLIAYDFPDMKRSYEVMPGTIEKVGYITVDTNDKPVQKKSKEPQPQGYSLRDAGVGFQRQEGVGGYIVVDRRGQSNPETLDRGDIGYDRIELDKDWIRKNKDKSDFSKGNAPQVALKLLKKIRFKPFQIKPIEIFYTNGKRAVAATFSPPPPIVLDMPEKELPKVVIFEKRLKSLTASKNWRWDVVEIRILDILGNVTQEKLEMSWKSTWKNSASNPKPEVGP